LKPGLARSPLPATRPAGFLLLLGLTAAAFAAMGYHPAAEDAEIYVPSILKTLHPSLFPFDSQFFQPQTHLTLYPKLLAASMRLTHLSLGSTMLLWQLLAIFLVLLACWKLSQQLFDTALARWGGVALVAALLTIPVAGTALYILDQYPNPRSLALIAILFALSAALRKKYWAVALWTTFAAAIHPLMAVFGLSLVAVIVWQREFGVWPLRRGPGSSRMAKASAALLLPLAISCLQPSPAYSELIRRIPYFFLLRWQWYEWLGIIAPFALLGWFSWMARQAGREALDLLCRALIVYELVYFAIALAITIPPQFLSLVHYQPMRSLQLVYVLMFLIMGGWLAEGVLRRRAWAWIALFLPLSLGMFCAQRQLFPSVPHIEWPGRAPAGDWEKTFAWISANTPANSFFALNPYYMNLPREDHIGFRALAGRSRLADAMKDSAPITLFPDGPLAGQWLAQVRALSGWEHFQAPDFERLKRDWNVSWVILDQRGLSLPDCPFSQGALRVCRLD
jgi:hypothetical protein